MKNIANNKTVQRMEWIKTNTVVITYSDGKKETMSRAKPVLAHDYELSGDQRVAETQTVKSSRIRF